MKNKETRQWSGRSRGGSLGHNAYITVIRYFGVHTAYILLSLIVVYFIPFAPKATRAIWIYNRKILKYNIISSLFHIYLHYFRFGQTLIDKVAINQGLSDKFKFIFDEYSDFIKVLDAGGVMIIGAHVGSWEIGSKFFGDYASKLNVVMYDVEYEKIKKIHKSNHKTYNIIPVNEGGIESMVAIHKVLSKGEYVCMQGDRYLDKSGATKVKFMGYDALFAKGPSLLASKFKTPIVFYFAMRQRGLKYRFHFKVIEPGHTQEEILALYTKELESIVKQYPQQWFNFYDLWSI